MVRRISYGANILWQKATNLIWGYEEEFGFKYDLIIRFRLDNLLNNHSDGQKGFSWKRLKKKRPSPRN